MVASSPVHKDSDEKRSRDASFFLVLFLVVGPLWCAVPLSWAFVLYSLHSGAIWSYAWSGKILFAVCLAEVFFSVYHFHLSKQVAAQKPHPAGNLEELRAAYVRVVKSGLFSFPEDGFDEESLNVDRPGSPAEHIVQLEHDDPRAEDFRRVLRTWFQHAPWSAIRLTEMKKWLYWSIFNAHMPESHLIPKTHRIVLDDALDLLQKRTGCTIPDGSSSEHQPLLLTLDAVRVLWRPFSFYAIVGVLNKILKAWFVHNYQLRFGAYDGLEYLIRIPTDWDSTNGPRPLVFAHGLGLGLIQYHIFIMRLLDQFTDRPIFILLQPHISQDLFHPSYLKPMNRNETTQRLASLFSSLGWVDTFDDLDDDDDADAQSVASSLILSKGVTFISHSNGSYCHAWMLKNYPHMVSRSCFVDPVTFCSWEGDVCYNFIYRPCTTGLQLIMRYFVATELGVANLLQRHFDWSSNSLWFEEIPNARDPSKSFFLMGANDEVLRADRVHRYLRSHGVRKGLWLDPAGHHGSALIPGGEGHAAILEWLKED
ncbi:hypothetical protein ONZ45_g3679 [Pleurotus djamor]|nr:hypothetical protein ONZ45_g3679 [Pleurotus djamor]